jgi:hypothetical protein
MGFGRSRDDPASIGCWTIRCRTEPMPRPQGSPFEGSPPVTRRRRGGFWPAPIAVCPPLADRTRSGMTVPACIRQLQGAPSCLAEMLIVQGHPRQASPEIHRTNARGAVQANGEVGGRFPRHAGSGASGFPQLLSRRNRITAGCHVFPRRHPAVIFLLRARCLAPVRRF